MNSPLFRAESIDFQSNRLHGEILVLPSINSILVTIFITFWVLTVITWLSVSHYSSKETVLGWLEPPDGVLRVYSKSTVGRVDEIFINEGQYVKEGQELFSIEGNSTLANGKQLEGALLNEYKSKQDIINQQLNRLTIINEIKLKDIEQQQSRSNVDLKLINDQISLLNEQKKILKSRIEKYKKMNRNGYVSDDVLGNYLQSGMELENDLQELLRARVNQENRIEQLQTQLMLLPKEFENEKDSLLSEMSDVAQAVTRLEGQQKYVIKAMTSGFVTNLQAQKGQQANINAPLLTIVPDKKDIEVRLLVPASSVGFIAKGQTINIRYDAFPYQKFGLYSGKITSISESVLLPNEVHSSPLDITEAVFLVKAALDNKSVIAYGKNISLKSGMTLSADISLSERTILEWIFEPIFSLKGRI